MFILALHAMGAKDSKPSLVNDGKDIDKLAQQLQSEASTGAVLLNAPPPGPPEQQRRLTRNAKWRTMDGTNNVRQPGFQL